MDDRRWLTIHFIDGSEMKFDFPHQDHDPETIAAVVDKSLNSKQLILVVEGVMHMFSIQSRKIFKSIPKPRSTARYRGERCTSVLQLTKNRFRKIVRCYINP